MSCRGYTLSYSRVQLPAEIPKCTVMAFQTSRAHDGASWTAVGKLEIPTCPVTAYGTAPTLPLSFLQRWLLLQTPTPPHTHASSPSTPPRRQAWAQTGLHIWILSHLHSLMQHWDRLASDDLLLASVAYTATRVSGHWFPALYTGLLRYRSCVDADAGNGSERACPPADLFTEDWNDRLPCSQLTGM